MKDIKSQVKVWSEGNAYMIEVTDQFSRNSLAVTHEELEKIILYGSAFLKPSPTNS